MTSIQKLVIGVAGGSAVEAVDQAVQVGASVAGAAMEQDNPVEIIKAITQIIIAIGTLISLFKRTPRKRDESADRAS